MLNLLRRRSRKKNPSQVPSSPTTSPVSTKRNFFSTGPAEYYRQLTERESEHAGGSGGNGGLMRWPVARAAVIEELDDDDLNDTDEEEASPQCSGRKERRFYFERTSKEPTTASRWIETAVFADESCGTSADKYGALGGGGNSATKTREWQLAHSDLKTSQNVSAEWLGRVSSPTRAISDRNVKNFDLNSNNDLKHLKRPPHLQQQQQLERNERTPNSANTTCFLVNGSSPYSDDSLHNRSIWPAKDAEHRHRGASVVASSRAKHRTDSDFTVITSENCEPHPTVIESIKVKAQGAKNPFSKKSKKADSSNKYQNSKSKENQGEKDKNIEKGESEVVKSSVDSPLQSDPNQPVVKLRRRPREDGSGDEAKRKRQSRLSLTFAGLTSSNKTPKETDVDRNSSVLTDCGKKLIGPTKGDRPLGALQKSKEFLSDLFMARGRNNQRHRNSQQQQQHQHHQQQQHAPAVAAVSITGSGDETRRSRSRSECSSNSVGDPSDYLNCQKSSSATIVNRSRSSSSIHLETMTDGRQHQQQQRQQPEMKAINGDPAASYSCPISTNSSQMTGSNNSPHDFSQANGEHPEERREQVANNSAENERVKNNENSLRERGALAERQVNGCGPTPQWPDGDGFNRATDIERNGATSDIDAGRQYQAGGEESAKRQGEHSSASDDNRFGTLRNGIAIDKGNDNCFGSEVLRENVLNCDVIECESSDPSMGQVNGKPENLDATGLPHPPRNWEFRESRIPSDDSASHDTSRDTPTVPKITIVDYSDNEKEASTSESSSPGGPNSLPHQEIFYEFEQDEEVEQEIKSTPIDVIDETDDGLGDEEVYQPEEIPASYFQKQWSPSMLRRTLEQVPEEENEDEDDEERESKNGTESPENRGLNASGHASDSNLSSSFPDSGIGDSHGSATSSTGSSRPPIKPRTLDHEHSHTQSQSSSFRSPTPTRSTTGGHYSRRQSPFSRDGNSTDCDDTLMPADEEVDFVLDTDDIALQPNERLVCIESISLPDVVVESTTVATSSNASQVTSSAANGSATATASAKSSSIDADGEHIININGATGNSMGNVHFIPIHVEGDNGRASPKRRSIDDSVIGSSAGMKTYNSLNPSKPTIEIIEDASESYDLNDLKSTKSYFAAEQQAEKLKRELADQKTRYNEQLEDSQKNVHNLQTKIGAMQEKIANLEQELTNKAWNVERLQSELTAAHKDDDYVRKKLKLLEDEKTNLRHKYNETEDEFKSKYDELEKQYEELEEKYKNTHCLVSNLQTQLAEAQTEVEKWKQEVEKIRADLEDQIRILKNALENSEAERKICQDKWQKEFEMLRNQNQDREESLMTDCEWQMRQMQKTCKDKLDKVSHERKLALERVEDMESALEERDKEVEYLKSYESEVKSLRGVVTEQERSVQMLMTQIETLKAELKTANDNLEEQIEAVHKIKYQCDNAIYDKERQTLNRIEEIRQEAAAFWEDKLYAEMTRLKNELESVYVDERRDALDKLQDEHIQELRALTTRYTANEEELRNELQETQESLERKKSEFLELRDKTDNDLLKTRMHLDRADREYQAAMCREEQRREDLEAALRKEFEQEKLDMEEKFRERLGQVKDEFAHELQLATQDMVERHRKEMEKQRTKLLAEREEALQELAERHRKKLQAVEDQMSDIELRHSRDLKDLKAAYVAEKASLDKRDISNANEIEQLHRKCRCLTNLFEEMRMRYERRDPRQEDLREISELRSRCEEQERDLYVLTDRLREMQIEMARLQQNGSPSSKKGGSKTVKKPPPKTIPTSCDVIYEENEERESSTDEDDDGEEQEVEKERVAGEGEEQRSMPAIDELHMNGKPQRNTINEDDSHMITAV